MTKSLPMGQSKAQNILDKIIPQISEAVDRAKELRKNKNSLSGSLAGHSQELLFYPPNMST